MNWNNDITQLLGIENPIVQAPMFGVTTPEMVAAASKAGCLGSLALGDLSADECIEAIKKTKLLTEKHFAVNIFVHAIPEVTGALKTKYAVAKKFIEQLAEQHQLDVALPEISELKINGYQDQVDAIISEGCKIVSFTFGNLDSDSIQKLKSNGTVLIGTCTSVTEAIILEQSGIDIICVQGLEAGGHRGSFASETIPEIGGFSLLSQVSAAFKVPLIYAGGISNAKTLLASKVLGASGFQVGSLLLGSAESALEDFEKTRLRNVKEEDIVLTKSFSGRFARGIKNTFISEIDKMPHILPYPYQNKLTAGLRKEAKNKKNADFVNIWVGQSIGNYSGQSTTEILRKLIEEIENEFTRFKGVI